MKNSYKTLFVGLLIALMGEPIAARLTGKKVIYPVISAIKVSRKMDCKCPAMSLTVIRIKDLK